MRDSGVRLTIDSDLGQVHLVGLAVHRWAEASGFAAVAADHIQIAVVEAVNNVIIHAYRSEPGHDLSVEVQIDADMFVIRVRDAGRSMPEASRPQRPPDPRRPENPPEGGYGRWIMHRVMDRVIYARDNGMNVLTLIKHRPGAAGG